MVKDFSNVTDSQKEDVFSAICDKVASAVFCRIQEQLSQQAVQPVSTVNRHPALGDEELIPKTEACHILGRCDATLAKWARRGILVPVRRGGQLYYKRSDVMRMYKGIL